MSALIIFLFKIAMLAALFGFLYQVMRLAMQDLGQRGQKVDRVIDKIDETQEFEIKPDLIVQKSISWPEGKIFHIIGGLTIGRSQNSDIVLEDNFVSSAHARIYRLGGDFFIEDLGSTNGTYLNDMRIEQPMTLKDGYLLTVGDSIFRFQE